VGRLIAHKFYVSIAPATVPDKTMSCREMISKAEAGSRERRALTTEYTGEAGCLS